MAELHELPALALRDLLRSGKVSATDAAAHFLARTGQQNPLLGAFITVTADQALEQARAADAVRASADADDLPLLHGMPLAFKDLTDVAGVVTTHGSAALDHKPAPADSPLVSLFKDAGVVTLGKTQVPEFGLTAYSENRVAPPSRNPHAPSRSSGGSSGGSAAAVAAGLLPFAPAPTAADPCASRPPRADWLGSSRAVGWQPGKARATLGGWWCPGPLPGPRRTPH
ncbi:Asp-tRNA(Asn)/Glu-tRNA(Gln) amidotransferase A subunit family amidase [Arthrobacter ulcerisalmonis]|nr:Asp-tRNA(Asn)/Glu-tRNA(Gln) amidotransferase A subunit family amidase [Arthrobacter ulcerisalmonis]